MKIRRHENTFKCYVPVLKSKEGEFKAVRNMKNCHKINFVPLFEMEPLAEKDASKYISSKISKFKACQGSEVFFVDMSELSDSVQALLEKELFDDENKLDPIIVCSLDKSLIDKYLQQYQEIALRITFDSTSHNLESLVERHHAKKIDIIVDLGCIVNVSESLIKKYTLEMIESIPYIHDWRSLILTSSAFPESVPGVGMLEMKQLPRKDFKLWSELFNMRDSLKRVPIYSDYGIEHPGFREGLDFSKIPIYANIRYSTKNDYLFFHGNSNRKNGYEDYPKHCRKIVALEEFQETGCSFGWSDEEICKYASGMAENNGNPTVWRAIGTHRHINITEFQLSSLFSS